MFERIWNAITKGSAREPEPLLAAAVVRDALHAAFDSLLRKVGFERPKPLKWVRSTKVPIRELVEILPLKGAAVSARWGYSIDFVPHVSSGRVRWHRTAKSALLDLVWDPLDFAGLDGWTFSRFGVEAELASRAHAFAAKVCRSALGDLDRASQISDLPVLYREWAARPTVRFSIENYNQAFLVEAFVKAHLHQDDALSCLQAGAKRAQLDDALVQDLVNLFDSVSKAE